MSDVRKQNWDELPIEELTPLIGRRLIYSDKMMLAHVYLKQGAIVPAHDHINEQFTYVLSGTLRFWLGAHAGFELGRAARGRPRADGQCEGAYLWGRDVAP